MRAATWAMHRARPRARKAWRCTLAAAWLAAGAATPAGAVITTVADTGSTYSLVLRVGAVSGVDTVAFNVTANNAGLTPVPVTSPNTIDIFVTPARPVAVISLGAGPPRPVTLTVNSALGLLCQSAGCGLTQIPFNQISWTATNNSNATAGDIQSGRFNGSTGQQIANYNANASICFIFLCDSRSNTLNATRLQFTYDNNVVYPAGNYSGVVRFTASME